MTIDKGTGHYTIVNTKTGNTVGNGNINNGNGTFTDKASGDSVTVAPGTGVFTITDSKGTTLDKGNIFAPQNGNGGNGNGGNSNGGGGNGGNGNGGNGNGGNGGNGGGGNGAVAGPGGWGGAFEPPYDGGDVQEQASAGPTDVTNYYGSGAGGRGERRRGFGPGRSPCQPIPGAAGSGSRPQRGHCESRE